MLLMSTLLVADENAAREASVQALDSAKGSLRSLVHMVPAGVTSDLLHYARACLARGDPAGAHESVRRWSAKMRDSGVFREPS